MKTYLLDMHMRTGIPQTTFTTLSGSDKFAVEWAQSIMVRLYPTYTSANLYEQSAGDEDYAGQSRHVAALSTKITCVVEMANV